MIEINCNGGRIGRLWWENSSRWFGPGRWGWDHAWPDIHVWPISPWGKGDPADECYRDFHAFEAWFSNEGERQGLILDLALEDISDKIRIYSMFCNVFKAGIAAGRDPWHWANELQRQTEQHPTQLATEAV